MKSFALEVYMQKSEGITFDPTFQFPDGEGAICERMSHSFL